MGFEEVLTLSLTSDLTLRGGQLSKAVLIWMQKYKVGAVTTSKHRVVTTCRDTGRQAQCCWLSCHRLGEPLAAASSGTGRKGGWKFTRLLVACFFFSRLFVFLARDSHMCGQVSRG